MQLVRLIDDPRLGETPSAHTFDKLYSQWAVQVSSFGDTIEEFAKPYMDHAQAICAESPADDKYGIHALEEDGNYYAFMHINWAQIPGVKDWTLRILWIQTCPRYEYEDLTPQFVAGAVASILQGADNMAHESPRKCSLIKIHVGNSYDRSFWSSCAAIFNKSNALPRVQNFRMVGSWLHITY